MAEDEEVAMEVEAVEAVYGDDCVVLQSHPPRLHLHVKPRTADVSSQQFVEAVLEIQAGSQEAMERLSGMNHPDGNCPLCLLPLVEEDADDNKLPFMKLMSCFHCFHCDCIIRWWNWLQSQKETNLASSSVALLRASRDMVNQQEEITGSCPVCRRVFLAKDIEHVLDLVSAHSELTQSCNDAEANEDENLLQADSEKIRRQKFEAILKLQQENNGLIEPRKDLVLQPGMFLPRPIPQPTAVSTKETAEQRHTDPTIISVTSGGSSNRPSTNEHRNSGMRKHRGQNSRKQISQWIKKENGNADSGSR
ncbi:uncharacterized protein LOC127801757 isoform X3 [Diospyros lotus]|uniref:uncharacterized protein LOC127801757 isoform X3 n=1 Tax=Diospyros lotus TaxID=55363 RepID=UPI002257A56F|nr:uncharacterized protein LOC127801757 isoform X3 [Diospyros lotus]